MAVFKKKGHDTKIQGTEQICKEETEDDVIMVKEIKQEYRQIMKLPPHLTCSVCTGLLKEPVQLRCCKTSLCKLCAFVKLERHTQCWFGFCPKSIPLSKEGLKVSAELAIQVDLWRIQKKEQIKKSSMVTEIIDAKKDDAKFVPKNEYIEADVKCAKREGVRYKLIQGKIMCAATGSSSVHFDPKIPSSSTEANKDVPVSILSSKTVNKSKDGLELTKEKQLQTNEHCLEVKTVSSGPKLSMKMKRDWKEMQTNEDCFQVKKSARPNLTKNVKDENQLQLEDCLELKNYPARLNLPIKMKEMKHLQTNEDCYVVETYSVGPNLSMKQEEGKQLQTNEDCLEVKNNSVRSNLLMKKDKKQSQRIKDCLEEMNYSVRPKLPMTINENYLRTGNDLARLSPPIINLVEIKEETSMSPTKMARWVSVCGNDGEEAIDIATEHDGTLLLSSVKSQFPGTTGLKYRNPETNNFCGIRCHREILFAPSRYEGWSGLKFVCVRPNIVSNKQKRKAENEGQMSKKKIKVNEDPTRRTLIIRGFPLGIPDYYVKNYFKKFGEVTFIQIKRQPIGIVYIKFAKQNDEEKVMSQKHMFQGRWFDVQVADIKDDTNHGEHVIIPEHVVILGLTLKIPEDVIKKYFEKFGEVLKVWLKDQTNSGELWGYAFIKFTKKEVVDKVMLQRHKIVDHWCYTVQASEVKQKDSKSIDNAHERTIYVGKLTKALSAEDLRDHFESFGRVNNVRIPKPQTFAFVEFKDRKVAMAIQDLGDHVIKGVGVSIRRAVRRNRIEC